MFKLTHSASQYARSAAMWMKTAGGHALRLTLLSPLLLLTACALSPQYVDIDPDSEVNHQLPVSQVVLVQVEDNRGQEALGTRGGTYSDTSFIYPSKSLSESLTPAAEQALRELGLDTQGPSPMPIKLTLIVDQLSYQMNDSALPKVVTLTSRVRAKVDRGGEHYEGRYSSSQSRNFMTSPNDEANRQMVNAVLSDTLTRLFNDPEILKRLR